MRIRRTLAALTARGLATLDDLPCLIESTNRLQVLSLAQRVIKPRLYILRLDDRSNSFRRDVCRPSLIILLCPCARLALSAFGQSALAREVVNNLFGGLASDERREFGHARRRHTLNRAQ